MAGVVQVHQHPPPGDHRQKEMPHRVVGFGGDDVCKIAVGFVEVQLVNQGYALLEAGVVGLQGVGRFLGR
jgi:hypothetical protein